ncbi:MAG: hypothetical protein AAB875_02675 [Patescibacteria group bacterium]
MAKKAETIKYFVKVEWQPDAIELGVAYSFLKDLVHYRNEKEVGRQQYTETAAAELVRNGIVVYDETVGQTIPRDSQLRPASLLALGKLQINRRMRV